MTRKNNTLKCHALCTCGMLALFIVVFFGGIGNALLVTTCGVYSAALSVANPAMGYRLTDSVKKRLVFVALEIVNISILAFCLLPLFVDMRMGVEVFP